MKSGALWPHSGEFVNRRVGNFRAGGPGARNSLVAPVAGPMKSRGAVVAWSGCAWGFELGFPAKGGGSAWPARRGESRSWQLPPQGGVLQPIAQDESKDTHGPLVGRDLARLKDENVERDEGDNETEDRFHRAVHKLLLGQCGPHLRPPTPTVVPPLRELQPRAGAVRRLGSQVPSKAAERGSLRPPRPRRRTTASVALSSTSPSAVPSRPVH